MRNIFSLASLVILIIIAPATNAQVGKAYEMTINGVKVIVQPSGNEIVVVQTTIKGGVQNYLPAKAGIEKLAITALTECGTTKDDKNNFKNKLDKVSAQMYGNAGMDFSSFTMNAIKGDFETVWPLYSDAMLNPKFDAKEFERIRQDAINQLRVNESNPDAAIYKFARQTAFAGKQYAKDPEGTAETVAKLSAEETKKHWLANFTRSKIVIVIVGDLDRSVIEKKVTDLLAKIPAGVPQLIKKESYTPVANTFKAEKRDNATNYIQGITGGPQPGTADFNAFALAMQIFSTRHFVEIRSNNGLSYAPAAWFDPGYSSFASFFVTTTEPDKYIAVARQLIDKVKKDGFTAEELKNIKTKYLTGVYYRQETNDAQANSLAANEVLHGDWKRSINIKDDIKKVSLEQLNMVFKKYITNITWSYQGDPKKVNATLFTQKATPAIPTEKKGF